MRIQATFGLIKHIQGKGPAASAVRDMCIRMRKEAPHSITNTTAGRISRMVLIDREVDVITPMMTQITFEGLIDEVTGIRNGTVPWQPKDKATAATEASQFGPSSSSGGAAGQAAGRGGAAGGVKGVMLLNSSDPFYAEFRDLPYHIAINRLQQHARDARREYTELASKDISELKTFVKASTGRRSVAKQNLHCVVCAPVPCVCPCVRV